jgi:hypothetical protein
VTFLSTTRLMRVWGLMRGVYPWVLLPLAVYVGLLPLLEPGRAFGQVLRTGLLGILGVGVPAAALAMLEARRSRRAALLGLSAATAAAVVVLAVSAGVLGAAIAAAAMAGAAYGYGRLLLARVVGGQEGRGWQDAPFTMAVGWAVWVVVGLAAGVAGWLTAPLVAAACLVGLTLAARTRGPAQTQPAESKTDTPAVFWWWGFVLLLLIGFIGALAPEVRHDALTAHLPIAREFAAQHRIVDMRQNTAAYFQLNADVLYALGMTLVSGAAVPKLCHFLAGATASLLTFSVGTRLWKARAGLAAAAVVAGTPLVWWVGGSAYTDLWVMLFALAAVETVLRYGPRPGAAFVFGLLVGAAMGTKLTAVVLVLPATVALLIQVAVTTAPRARWASLAALAAGGLLTGAFWSGRAWMLTGNPIFPLLGHVFGSGTSRYAREAPEIYGMGRSLWDIALVPWRTARYPGRFVEDGSLGVAYLLLLPAMMLTVSRRWVPRWFVAVLVAALMLWVFTVQYLRFLLPLLPLLALLGAAGLFGARRPAVRPLPAALILSAILAVGAGTWVTPGAPNFPVAVVLRRIAHEEYLARHVPGFRTAHYVRRTLPPSARIYSAEHDWVFYYERFLVSLSWYGRAYDRSLVDEVLAARTGEAVQSVLRRAGFTHLVLYPSAPRVAWSGRRGAWLGREAPWTEGPRLEYASDGSYLYALEDPAGPRRPDSPLIEVPPSTGNGEPYVSAPVGVIPGRLYALEATVGSASPEATASLVVEWRTADGRVLGAGTSRLVRAGAHPALRAVACTAPQDARSAVIRLATAGSSPVKVAGIRFYELR